METAEMEDLRTAQNASAAASQHAAVRRRAVLSTPASVGRCSLAATGRGRFLPASAEGGWGCSRVGRRSR
jgi:hypothetical protein